jgi:hypothetical protein
MIAQGVFSLVLFAIALVAFAQLPQIPLIGGAVICTALFGAYIVWMPEHATYVANLIGIGRGADLVLYVWVLIGSAAMLLLYLKLREHFQLITSLARKMALSDAAREQTRQANQENTPTK